MRVSFDYRPDRFTPQERQEAEREADKVILRAEKWPGFIELMPRVVAHMKAKPEPAETPSILAVFRAYQAVRGLTSAEKVL